MTPIPAPYQAMTPLAAAAAPRAQIWRTILGLILAALLAVLMIVAVMVPLMIAVGPAVVQSRLGAVMNSNTPAGVITLLYSFVPQMIALFLATLILLRRGPISLTGPLGPLVRTLLKVGLPLMALWLVLMPLSVLAPDVRQNITLTEQLPWLPAALLGLLIQTATEELLFRGYLQQQLAARFSSRWIWMGLPSLLFGLAHFAPGQPALVTGLTMLWAACFGLAAADLTARTGNLGAGLALHFTNNISAILLVGVAGNIGGLTLYQVTLRPDDTATLLLYLVLDGISLLVGWLIARLILRR